MAQAVSLKKEISKPMSCDKFVFEKGELEHGPGLDVAVAFVAGRVDEDRNIGWTIVRVRINDVRH